jgi:hypothetical protein
MVLNEWLGFAYRFLYRLLRLCHRAKRYLLATYVSLLWLLDSPFDDSLHAQARTSRSCIPAMVYGLGRPKYINRRIKKMEKEF